MRFGQHTGPKQRRQLLTLDGAGLHLPHKHPTSCRQCVKCQELTSKRPQAFFQGALRDRGASSRFRSGGRTRWSIRFRVRIPASRLDSNEIANDEVGDPNDASCITVAITSQPV